MEFLSQAGMSKDAIYIISTYLVLSLLSILVIYVFKRKSNKEIQKLEEKYRVDSEAKAKQDK
ncbi:hypothetical protein [Peribacillus sp. FSL M8-0224]|uniref:hypothetical protein n=1 Tax=Peribacillus sp. FSL M8-0224 TaxID=2921568 RepID=UPI0030F94DC4|nr:hypothetical protein KY492_27655 [Brevibacterium sp. PAMC21349]